MRLTLCMIFETRFRTNDIIKVVLKAITNKTKVIYGSVIERHSCHTEDKNKIAVTRNIDLSSFTFELSYI